MENFEPVVQITGNSAICGKYVPWAKNKAKYLLSTSAQIQTVSFPLVDTDSNKKRVDILITIKINAPFCHIFITTSNQSKTTLTSGLSRQELNYPNLSGSDQFIYFYPQPGNKEDTSTTFRPEKSLYKSNQIVSVYKAESTKYTFDLEFQKIKNSLNVGIQHYLFGSMFTGEMKHIFQLMLASNLDIGYRPFALNTDGIYTDSKGNKHLINISPNGVYTKELTYNSYKSNIIDISIPDGIAIDYEKDTKILDFTIYNNLYYLELYQGWAFNSDGSIAQNVFAYTNELGFLETYRLSIVITDNKGVLSASLNIVESARLYILQQDRLMGGLSRNNANLYMPENLSNYKYNSAKKGTLSNIPLIYFSTMSDIVNLNNNVDYKAPLSVYFNDKDEAQVVYYNIRKEPKSTTIIRDNADINSPSDFFHEDTYNEGDFSGWVKRYGNFEFINDNIDLGNENLFNTKIYHGFMINNDTTTLSEDNGGDICTKYSIFNGVNSITNDTLIYDIQQNNIALSDYNYFQLSTYTSNSQNIIKNLNYKINTYKDNFIKTLQNQVTTYLLDGFSSFKVDLQIENINYFLQKIDSKENLRLLRVNPVTTLKNIDNIALLNIKDINYSPLLYKINFFIKDYFDYFINNSVNFESVLNTLSDSIDSINNSYSINTREQLIPLLTYLKSSDDSENLDYEHINQQIANLNTNIIPLLNSYYDNINQSIDNFNNIMNQEDLFKNFVKKVNEYSGFVETYNQKYFNSLCNDFAIKILNNWEITTSIVGNVETHTKYYAVQQLNKVNRSVSQTIRNRKINYSSLVFNIYNRNSFAIFNQEDNFDNINYYNTIASNSTPVNSLKNINIHSDVCETNLLRFFKQDNLYNNSTNEYTYVDAQPIEDIAFNSISKNVADYAGNISLINAVAFAGNSLPNYKITNSNSSFVSGNQYINYLPGTLSNTYTNEEINLNNHYDIKDVNFNKDYLKYQSTINKSFKVYGLENTLNINTTNILDYDKRFITDVSNASNVKNKNFVVEERINDYDGDGVTYFLCSKDVFSNSYVINKDFYSFSQEQFFLTNITIYPNINYNSNVYSVNYLGMPFFGKNNGV